MSRTVFSEIAYDSTCFTPHQLHPRSVLSMGFANWARWADRHLVAFPQMIKKFGTGFVVVRVRVDYPSPFGFLDGGRLGVSTAVAVEDAGTHLRVGSTIRAGDRPVAVAECYARCVRLDSEHGYGAGPGRIPDDLIGMFTAAERDAPPPPRVLLDRLDRLDAGHAALAEDARTVTVHRGMCEVADQWSFVELPAQLGASRELLVADRGREVPALRPGLTRPLRSIDIELLRPLFLLDQARFAVSAHAVDGGLTFGHRITGRHGRLHALAEETYDPA